MKRRTLLAGLAFGFTIIGCSEMPSMPAWVPGSGWTTLIDGEKGLENFNRVGDANWRAEGGAIVADKGKGGHLVTKNSYKDFQIRAEFWADRNTNSGVFMRLSDPKKITDQELVRGEHLRRSGQSRSTAPAPSSTSPPCRACPRPAGKWNVYEITAKGDQITVVLNGEKTVEVRNNQSAQGPFSLQFGNHGKEPGGAIKWRKVQVKEL